jgi:hypothetical protein
VGSVGGAPVGGAGGAGGGGVESVGGGDGAGPAAVGGGEGAVLVVGIAIGVVVTGGAGCVGTATGVGRSGATGSG